MFEHSIQCWHAYLLGIGVGSAAASVVTAAVVSRETRKWIDHYELVIAKMQRAKELVKSPKN